MIKTYIPFLFIPLPVYVYVILSTPFLSADVYPPTSKSAFLSNSTSPLQVSDQQPSVNCDYNETCL